ncbi:MAG: hypothetical protein LBT42_05125 [Tannerella sp.]|nr:hypothetical protein [Tannerella sp.]
MPSALAVIARNEAIRNYTGRWIASSLAMTADYPSLEVMFASFVITKKKQSSAYICLNCFVPHNDCYFSVAFLFI